MHGTLEVSVITISWATSWQGRLGVAEPGAKETRVVGMSGVELPRSLDEFHPGRGRRGGRGFDVSGYVSIAPHGRIRPDDVDWHKTDSTVYTEAALAFFHGRDPYRVMVPRGWYYLYPPSRHGRPSPDGLRQRDAADRLYVVSIVMAFGRYFGHALRRRLLAAESPRSAAGVFARGGYRRVRGRPVGGPRLATRPGRSDAPLFPALGFRLVVRSRAGAAGLAGGVILAVPGGPQADPDPSRQLPPGTALGLAYRSRRRGTRAIRASTVTAGVVLGGLLFLIVIPAAIVGWRKNLDYLHTWTVQIASNQLVGRALRLRHPQPAQPEPDQRGLPLVRSRALGAGRPAAPRTLDLGAGSVQGVRGVILVILAGFCLATGRRGRPLDLALGYALACAAPF